MCRLGYKTYFSTPVCFAFAIMFVCGLFAWSDAVFSGTDLAPLSSTKERPKVDADRVVGQLDDKKVSAFVAQASSLSTYAAPSMLPKILRIEDEELKRILCNGARCMAVAFFDDETQIIYINASLDLGESLASQSFVIHEIIHYLQYLDGKMSDKNMACLARMRLEEEAYKVQNKFLAKSGSLRRTMDARMLRRICYEVVR